MTRVRNIRGSGAAKVTISLPRATMEAVERECRARQETRSEFFRHAVEAFLRQEQEREAVERYVRGYREHPETEEEIAAAHQAGCTALAQEPWE